MPAPASPLPLTVLVLAWDAAAPAVRTLIEAAPGLVPTSLGPMLVLVPPPAEASAELIPEPTAAPAVLAEAALAAAELPPTTPDPTPTQAASGHQPAVAPGPAAPAAPASKAAPTQLPRAQPTREAAVRVIQLTYAAPSSASLFTGLATTRLPAAPYLGATPPPAGPALGTAATPKALPVPSTASQPVADVVQPAGAALASAVSQEYNPAPYTTDEALAPDLEADLLSGLAAVQEETSPLVPAQPASATTTFSLADQATAIQPDASDGLSLDAEALAEPATAAIPADEPGASGTNEAPALVPTAEETLPATLPLDDKVAEPEPAAVASPPLQPAAASYPAPDLNTQVIRYARFVVPAALAEGPFGAIYAPAWPTWLAALELRQRTGCPLVLHLSALAAGRDSADTAAGWPAEIQRQVLRQADVVLTETYALARRLRRELGLASTRVRVVPAADGGAVARALRRARREAAR